jgi:predicted transcriptional regulator
LIINLENQQIGLFNKSQINNIEGAFIAMLFSDVEVYFIPKDETYTFEVTGYGSGIYDLSVIGVENDVLKKNGVLDVTCTVDTQDIYIFNFKEDTIAMSTEEEDKTYSLEFFTSFEDDSEEFYLVDMELDKNAIHIYKINDWETLSYGKPVTLYLYEDSQGITERKVNLQSGLTDQEVDGLLISHPISEPTAFPLLLFIIFGVVFTMGAFGLLTEVGKWALLSLIIPLYTRIKKENILDQPIRYKIHGYIIGNPGAHLGSIKKDLDLPNGQLAYHLTQLIRTNLIYSRLDRAKKRFYPVDYQKNMEDEDDFISLQEKILDIVKENSGINQKKVASEIGISRQVAGYHLTKMEKEGVIEKEVIGRESRYYASENVST